MDAATLFAVFVLFNRPGDKPAVLQEDYNNNAFGFIVSSIKKNLMLAFAHEICKRTSSDVRMRVEDSEKEMEHVANLQRRGNLTVVAITNRQYPERVVFDFVRQCHDAFAAEFPEDKYAAGSKLRCKTISALLAKYTNPKEADKILKVQSQVDDTIDIMHKNVMDMIERGKKIDDVLEASEVLNQSSKDFVKITKKANPGCFGSCSVM